MKKTISLLICLPLYVSMYLIGTPILVAAQSNAPSTTNSAASRPSSPALAIPMPPSVEDSSSEQYDHGPRAGFMRKAKSALSELLLGPASGYRLYFLDSRWVDLDHAGATVASVVLQKNPSKKDAPQPLVVNCGGRPTLEKPTFFVCELPKDVALADGDVVFAKYTAKDGTISTFNYTFPFKAHEPVKDYPAAPAQKHSEQKQDEKK